MSKVWINPAFKDKLSDKKEDPPPPVKEEKKEPKVKAPKKEGKQKPSEEKPQPEEKTPVKEKTEKKQKDKIENIPYQLKGESLNELKLLQILQQKNIPIEGMLVNGMKINGKIKWFTPFTLGLLLDDGRDIIVNRLTLIYYSQPKEYSLSIKDFNEIPKPIVNLNEMTELRRLKDEKAILLFHLKNGIDVTGKIDWSDFLTYHVLSSDDKKEYTIAKSSLLYIEEVKG